MRRQPVAFALIDAAFLADSKWRALGRRLPEPTQFNSAIGAWVRILTAARRNGLPDVDAMEEAEDQTYLPDLIAVGLLSETGIPEKPYRAWAPARPRYPGEIGTDSTNGTSATGYTVSTPSHASTPFTSTPLPRERGVGREIDERDWTDEQRKAAYVKRQSQATGVLAPIVPTIVIETPEHREREALRLEALALHERHLAGELEPEEYERLLADLGKPDDDLTRAGT